MTKDEHWFILDRVQGEYLANSDSVEVAVFAGGNGRAFKFAPLLGDCLASLVLGKDTPVDIQNFNIRITPWLLRSPAERVYSPISSVVVLSPSPPRWRASPTCLAPAPP